MDQRYQRSKFTELRFEFYASGRLLWFNDNLAMAGLNLGYAVELSLKQALIGAGATMKTDGKLLTIHEAHELFSECKRRGLLPDVEASEELLLCVSDLLRQRYPSQATQTAALAEDRGHVPARALDLICAYDDLLIQLDDSLCRQCADDAVSVGLLAAHCVNRVQGRSFFHCNVAALKNTERYRAALARAYEGSAATMRAEGKTEGTIQYNLALHQQRLQTWSEAPDSLWHYDRMETALGPDFEALSQHKYARGFVYPGRITKSPA